jgi:paraquat-inducible protein A
MTIACPDCGSLQDIPRLDSAGQASCYRCEGTLERRAGRSVTAAFALSAATLLLLVPGYALPFLTVRMLGRARTSVVGSGVAGLWMQDWVILAVGAALLIIVLPLVRFGLLTATLGAIRFGFRPPWLGPCFRWAHTLDAWAMQDVFLIGSFVGYSRVEARLSIGIDAGGWCILAAALLSMIARASLDRRTVWRVIAPERDPPAGEPALSCLVCDLVMPLSAEGSRCPRCGSRLHARRPNSTLYVTALVAAGYILYVPANLFPMTRLESVAGGQSHRIVDGVRDLVEAHLWPLAVIVFTASIGVPLLKLFGMSWFLISIRRRSTHALSTKTRLYRIIDEVGRWSNIDVFTIVVFLPLMQYGGLVSVHAGIGAAAFFSVVMLTMFASRLFDPRLMWDAAETSR